MTQRELSFFFFFLIYRIEIASQDQGSADGPTVLQVAGIHNQAAR